MDKKSIGAFLSIGLLLAGCGGGGGGDDPAAPAVFVAKDYAFTANFNPNGAGGVAVFALDPATGAPSPVGGSPFTAGSGTSGTLDVAVDPACRFVYAANQFSASISAYKVDGISGALSTISGSPFSTAGSAPLAVAVHPSGRFLYVATSSNVLAYAIDSSTGALTSLAAVAAAAASLAFDPSGRFAYTDNASYSVDAATGALTSIGSSVATGAVFSAIDPGGRFLYSVNGISLNGFTVSSYAIDANTGGLASVGPALAAGVSPRSAAIGANGKFLYVGNSAGSNVSGYSVGATGVLTSIGTFPADNGARSVAVDTTGKFAYVANVIAGTLSSYAINASTGALTSLGATIQVPSGSAQFPNPSALKIAHRAAP